VLAVDAGISSDTFAIVGVSRHPQRHDEVAVRLVRVFDPKESGGVVDLDECERYLRVLALGGCRQRHPRSLPDAACGDCKTGYGAIAPFNIVMITYDPYQLEQMMGRLRRDAVAWCSEFVQQGDRLKADRGLYDSIVQRRIAHNGDATLRQHVINAGAKLTRDDSTLRIVKQSASRKVDAAVALSMAASRCLYLVL
jgi:hypothetical protein